MVFLRHPLLISLSFSSPGLRRKDEVAVDTGRHEWRKLSSRKVQDIISVNKYYREEKRGTETSAVLNNESASMRNSFTEPTRSSLARVRN